MAKRKPAQSQAMSIGEIKSRFGITLREARDIATAVNNAAITKGSKVARKDLAKQIREVGTAVKKGEVGTTAGKVKGGKLKPGKSRNYPTTFNVVPKKEPLVSIRKKRSV